MKVWRPEVAYVLGAGQIGLLTTLVLKLRGLEVYTLARGEAPNLKAEITEGMEATYVSTRQTDMAELVKKTGKPDLIVDATGSSSLAFEAMQHVGHNGVVVWTSITGGKTMTVEVPCRPYQPAIGSSATNCCWAASTPTATTLKWAFVISPLET